MEAFHALDTSFRTLVLIFEAIDLSSHGSKFF